MFDVFVNSGNDVIEWVFHVIVVCLSKMIETK